MKLTIAILPNQAAGKRTAEVQSLQGELEDALESKDREVRRADSDRREMARLQERVLALESEQNSAGHNVRPTSSNHPAQTQ